LVFHPKSGGAGYLVVSFPKHPAPVIGNLGLPGDLVALRWGEPRSLFTLEHSDPVSVFKDQSGTVGGYPGLSLGTGFRDQGLNPAFDRVVKIPIGVYPTSPNEMIPVGAEGWFSIDFFVVSYLCRFAVLPYENVSSTALTVTPGHHRAVSVSSRRKDRASRDKFRCEHSEPFAIPD
jgi:hypothetical protein